MGLTQTEIINQDKRVVSCRSEYVSHFTHLIDPPQKGERLVK